MDERKNVVDLTKVRKAKRKVARERQREKVAQDMQRRQAGAMMMACLHLAAQDHLAGDDHPIDWLAVARSAVKNARNFFAERPDDLITQIDLAATRLGIWRQFVLEAIHENDDGEAAS